MKNSNMLGAILVLLAAPLSAQEHAFETDAERVPALDAGDVCVIRGATIHTATRPAFTGDVLVRQGKIVAVGAFDAPDGAVVLDGAGKHLAPGVVDCHSHLAIERGVNEGTLSITAEVRIQDSVDVDDVGIFRALAGGCTTMRLLHGSANAIGGQDAVMKLRWHADNARDVLIPGAETGIKFALGENPKRSGESGRYPGTRMGVESIYYRAFTRAREYAEEWERYEAARADGADPAPPRRDLRLETLRGILAGDVHVHSHCYRADEILMLVRAAQHYGFQIATLQHVLEGYKVAQELAEAGVGASAFSDWWAYKIEAYDAIPQGPSLMAEAGVLTSINSDSGEMIRRLYEEAGKSVRYADMDRVEALRLVTLHPAMQLGLDARIGSIEVGKDADLVLLNGDPLSTLSRVEWTMVDGKIEFTRRDAFGLDTHPGAVAELTESGAAPAGVQAEIALVGGTLHPVTGPAIENGTVLIGGGRLLAVGADVVLPPGVEVVNVTGKHVWPGMISLHSQLGLHEIGAVRMTDDTSEIGGNQPDLRVAASLDAESAHIGVTRWNGITRAQTSPRGRGPMRGQSAVIDLEGDTWEELLTRDRDMLHIAFPSRPNTTQRLDDELVQEDGRCRCDELHEEHLEHDHLTSGALAPQGFGRSRRGGDDDGKAVKELSRLLKEAREYDRLTRLARGGVSAAPTFDPRLEALGPVVRRERKVALHASNAQTILDAVKFAKGEDLAAVIYDATEAWKVVDVLAREAIPVVIGPVWSVPRSTYDPYDASFANAAVLQRAGVRFAITTNDTDNERNLPFQAAKAAAFGLPLEEAVRAVTYYPAQILGLDDRLGSLVPGKLADVVVTEGHLLEVTGRVTHVFIDGALVAHDDNKQTRLYAKYLARMRRLASERAVAGDAPAAPGTAAGSTGGGERSPERE
jgi:imidazolonepropionase-like amidohydrolase